MNAAAYITGNWRNRDSEAIVTETNIWDYGALSTTITRIGLGLLDMGIQPGDRCFLVAENSVFSIAAYLAIISIGAVAVPLSERITAEQALGLGQRIEPKALVASALFSQSVVFKKIGTLPVFGEMDLNQSAAPPVEGLPIVDVKDPQKSLAAIMFTSGSTGVPRGVMVSHANIIANTGSIIDCLALSETSRMMVVLPFSYCFGTSLLHTHLRVGGCLVLGPGFRLPDKVLDLMNKSKCTGFAGVPSHYLLLLQQSSASRMKFPALKQLQQAGGRLETVDQRRVRELFDPAQLYVMYGQTEATARLSCLPPDQFEAKMGSIGKSIPGVTLTLRTEEGTEPAPNAVGEIVAEGENITLGYWKDAEATRENFCGGKLHTGDLATRDSDGFFYIVGRVRNFLKLGGIRINSQDIESIIKRFAGILDLAVIGIPDSLLGEAVKLFVVHPAGSKVKDDLQAFCRKELPINQQPQEFCFLDALPKTDSGKIDRQALRTWKLP